MSEFKKFQGYGIKDATARDLIEKSKTFVTPEMYGAIGNGVADDTKAIQDAINSGFPIKCNNVTYLISETLTIAGKNHITYDFENTVINYTGTEHAFLITNVTDINIKLGVINAPNGGCLKLYSSHFRSNI